MERPRTTEAKEAARLIDRQPPETRVYLIEMLYRVAGLENGQGAFPREDEPLPPNVARLSRRP